MQLHQPPLPARPVPDFRAMLIAARFNELVDRVIRFHDVMALPLYMLSTFVTVTGFALGWWEPGLLQSVLLMVTAWFGGYTFAVLTLHWAVKIRGRHHDPHTA